MSQGQNHRTSEPFPTRRALDVAPAEQLVRDSLRRLGVRQFAQGEPDHRAGRHSPGLMQRPPGGRRRPARRRRLAVARPARCWPWPFARGDRIPADSRSVRCTAVNGRIIWLTLVALFGSLGADDEDLPGGVDDVRGDGLKLVDAHHTGDLGHEAFDEAEVAAGDLGDRVGRFGMVGVVGVEWLAQLFPVLGGTVGMSSGSSGWYWWANPIRLYSWG